MWQIAHVPGEMKQRVKGIVHINLNLSASIMKNSDRLYYVYSMMAIRLPWNESVNVNIALLRLIKSTHFLGLYS